MAGLTREQKAARAAEQDAPEASPPPAVVLVLMANGATTAQVHPTCVQAHVRAGWAVVVAAHEPA